MDYLEVNKICPHHSNQVAASVLSDQLLLAVLLHDDRAQSTAQHDERTIRLLFLSETHRQLMFTDEKRGVFLECRRDDGD